MLARSVWFLFSLLAMSQQRPGPPSQSPSSAPQAQEFRISGIVQDGVSGVPLEGTEVSISPSESPVQDAVAPVVTSAEGHFVFEHVTAGKYVLSAKRRGYASQNYDGHDGFTTAIVVGPQLDSQNLVFRIVPEAAITGQVIDQFGESVRRAEVILFAEGLTEGRTSIRRRGQTQTDDQGRYRLGGLPKGRYYVAVSARPWYAQNVTAEAMAASPPPDPNRPATGFRQIVEQNPSLDVVYPLTFYQGTTDSARASAISLDPGAVATADFSPVAVPALHLRLTAPGLDLSKPLAVSVEQSAFGLPGAFAETMQAWSDSDSIGIVGVPPGEIRLNAQGGAEQPLLFNETLNASEGMEINLNHQARGVPVSGVVALTAGARLPERTSLILREIERGRFSQTLIKTDGSFDFGDWVNPGKYTPTLSLGGGSSWYVAAVQAEGASVSGRVLDLRSADPVRLTVEISEGLGSVEGVAQRDGKGVGGAMIVLVSKELVSNDVAGGAVFGRDQSNSDGSFAIPNVPPGEYTVLAIQNGWDQEWGDPSVLRRWLPGGAAVRVAPNGKSSVLVNVQ